MSQELRSIPAGTVVYAAVNHEESSVGHIKLKQKLRKTPQGKHAGTGVRRR